MTSKKKGSKKHMSQMIAMVSRTPAMSSDDLKLMARFCFVQMNRDFAADWNQSRWDVTAFEDESQIPDYAYRHYFLSKLDVDGAAAYHEADAKGRPVLYTAVDANLASGYTMFKGPNSILAAASHENCETGGDPDAEEYVYMPDGIILPGGTVSRNLFVAKEACDPVQGEFYNITLHGGEEGSVSDYVTPAWFSQNARGQRMSHNQTVSFPFETDKGYLILSNGERSWDVFDSRVPAHVVAMKRANPNSRLNRRIKAVLKYR